MGTGFLERFGGTILGTGFLERFGGVQLSAASKVNGATSLTALLVGKQWGGGVFLERFGGIGQRVTEGSLGGDQFGASTRGGKDRLVGEGVD